MDKFLNHVFGYGWEEDAPTLRYVVGAVHALVGLAVRLVLFMANRYRIREVEALLIKLCFIYAVTGALAGMRVPKLIGVP